jgi:phosphate/phosphite/phosphonate ABC transporter binding protein
MRGQKYERGRRKRLIAAAAVAALLMSAAPALAQDAPNPFKFLKPWLEKQIFGKGPAEPATGEPTGALPDGDSETATSGPDVAPDSAESPDATSTEAAPVDAEPAETATGGPTPLMGENSVLRGGENGEGVGEPVELLPQAPPAGVAVGEPFSESELEPDVPPASEAKLAPLRFALLAGRSAAATMAVVGPVADDLATLLERPVEFLPFPSYAAMADAQVERRIDGGFYSAAAFALADTRCACLEPLVAPRAWDGTLSYHAIIVAPARSGIRALADLAGKTVAVGRPDSIGARRMQLAGLMAEGVDPAATFGSVLETASGEAAIRAVAAGNADAAFAWSSLAGRAEDGYSRGTLTDLVAKGAITMSDIVIVWQSPPIEHGPFAIARTLNAADKDKMEAYFVALADADPAAYDGLNPYYAGGYAPVDPADYSGVEVLAAPDVDALPLPSVAPTAGALAQ